MSIAYQDRTGAVVDALANIDFIATLVSTACGGCDGKTRQVEQVGALMTGIGLPGDGVGYPVQFHAQQLL
ncbi:hypothetical protein D3C85_1916600 [compost metagenome]